MKSISKTGSGIATLAFLVFAACYSSTLSAQVHVTHRHRGFERIYGQEDTYARTVRVTRRQRRSQRARLRTLRYRSYDGSGLHFSYGRSGRYGYSFYLDRSPYYSSYYRPWYYAPYSHPAYYFGSYRRGYYGYGSYGYRSYGHHHHYPSHYRGYGFGYAPY